MKVIPDFELELKQIDPRLSIVLNANRPHIANIKLSGTDICPIPANEIKDEHDPSYRVELPNGSFAPHRSRSEAIALVKHTLGLIQNPDNASAFFGTD